MKFTGREAISSLFEFTITVACEEEDVEALIGQSAHLQLESGDDPRSVHGIVSEVEYAVILVASIYIPCRSSRGLIT